MVISGTLYALWNLTFPINEAINWASLSSTTRPSNVTQSS